MLSGVDGPDHAIKLPSTVLHVLERMDRLLADDRRSAPQVVSMTGLIAAVHEQLSQAPVRVELAHPETGEVTTIKFPFYRPPLDKTE